MTHDKNKKTKNLMYNESNINLRQPLSCICSDTNMFFWRQSLTLFGDSDAMDQQKEIMQHENGKTFTRNSIKRYPINYMLLTLNRLIYNVVGLNMSECDNPPVTWDSDITEQLNTTHKSKIN